MRSLKLGAAGYLNKSADSEQMIDAIRKVAAGGAVHHAGVAEQLAGARSARSAADEQPLHERLSHREYQVFRLLATGRSVARSPSSCALAPNTVSTYRARILEKTGARNDVELALYAVRTAAHRCSRALVGLALQPTSAAPRRWCRARAAIA